MLNRLPKQMPSLEMMLADIGNPRPDQLAKALGVSVKTIYRWKQEEEAPRVAMLALFFVTQWGRGQVHCDAHNDALQQAQIAACYRSQLKEMQAQLKETQAQLVHLGRIGDFGAANDPSPEVMYRIPALPMLAILGDPVPAAPAAKPKRSRKKTASQKRAALASRRLTKRAEGEAEPFDFLRVG